jgi:hypothetical protein
MLTSDLTMSGTRTIVFIFAQLFNVGAATYISESAPFRDMTKTV